MFFFKRAKKELDITDAIVRKQARITIGGKPVVVQALKLAPALELLGELGQVPQLLKLAAADRAAFNRALLAKLPVLLRFCVPDEQIKPENVTLTEFADLLLALWCVNDLERVVANFTQAVQSLPTPMRALAASPKF